MTDAITTIAGGDISTGIANMAGEFAALAARLAEASRSLRKATQRERFTVLDALAAALRDAGMAAHEHARTLEAIAGRPKP